MELNLVLKAFKIGKSYHEIILRENDKADIMPIIQNNNAFEEKKKAMG